MDIANGMLRVKLYLDNFLENPENLMSLEYEKVTPNPPKIKGIMGEIERCEERCWVIESEKWGAFSGEYYDSMWVVFGSNEPKNSNAIIMNYREWDYFQEQLGIFYLKG